MKKILYSFPIRAMTFDGRVTPRPVIGFGSGSRESVNLLPTRDYYTTIEPSLLTYEMVKEIAKDNHVDIVGPDMVGELPVCNFKFTYDFRNPDLPLSEVKVHNLRTTADLVAAWPCLRGKATWQINTRTDEFQIVEELRAVAA